MKKYFAVSLVLLSVILIVGCGKSAESNPSDQDYNAKTILFTSSTCPHCKDVEDYIKENNVKERISFTDLIVNSDEKGANLMVEKQKKCQLEENYIGAVPFLWNDGECYLGDEQIIEFFKKQNDQ